MLAIASLATGFVVAAITPSPAADHDGLGDLNVKDTFTTVDHTIGHDSLAVDEGTLGENS